MESAETWNPEKRRLLEASERHKLELEKEVKSISDKSERVLINALIIGGSLALTYFVISQWGKSKARKKKKSKTREASFAGDEEDGGEPESPSLMSQVGKKVVDQLTLILLDVAKEKLLEYLDSRKRADENS